ncbi:MAG: alanyl-tRNA synthetase [Gammaproteobacteria bacterium SG8_31]|nr:MAG: alanyl-tRNA synthetase [Gammaproteobacteria bacterium SG8_31]
MKSAEIRQRFLDYFERNGHQVVASSPLVPANDPTLLFTNAGMVQFKDVFLGLEKRPYNRAASSQRCVRAGGKHNDLENVGYTARHHTFFEMLGNFSFGDYFKREAIRYGWEFLTEDLGLPGERLWVTIYEEDDEAAGIWLEEIGVSPEQFRRLGADSNFWAMGDTGPCGPCTEIFYDHGPDVPGGPPGSPDEDGDRFVEVWNLVFMQYERAADGSMKPLPKPSVDTGMGLERIAAVMQGTYNNYQIDLFQSLMKAAAEATGVKVQESPSLRVIADHIRACAFLIVDGVLPSNEGRGYVLRRIIRRAIRHGYKLGQQEPFFHRLVGTLDKEMGEAYPELSKARERVEQVLLKEERRFAETLDQGMGMLEDAIDGLKGKVIPGETAFKLYDTYGFPLDLTADIARERGLRVDESGFSKAMEAQRERGRAASVFGANESMALAASLQADGVEIPETEFTGYDQASAEARVGLIVVDGKPAASAAEGDRATVFLDRTPFYAESGGQVGDTGTLFSDHFRMEVTDTQKVGKAHGHIGRIVAGQLSVGDTVTAAIDTDRREAIVLNHSATHLLHAALREVLGEHVTQKGSLVAPDRLRFDFSHNEPVTAEELQRIESLVNDQIRLNAEAETALMDFDEAVAAGAMALFGEKYDSRVRVLRIGDFSTELCGGTHVTRAGDIGMLKITSETGIAAGVRRIEAVTGDGALAWVRAGETALSRIADMVRGSREEAEDKVRHLLDRSRQLEKEVRQLKATLASGQGSDLAERATDVDGIKVLAARVDGADPKALREAVDRLKQRLGTAVVVLGSVEDDKARLVAGVTKDVTDRVKAGALVGEIAPLVGGRGGGRPDMAQAGGSDPGGLDAALERVRSYVTEQIS